MLVQNIFDGLSFIESGICAKPDFPDQVLAQIERRKLKRQGENAKTHNAHDRYEEHIRAAGNACAEGSEHEDNVARVFEIRAEIDDGQRAQYADACRYVVADGLQDHGGDERAEHHCLQVIGRSERARGSEIVDGRNQGGTQERQEKGENDHFKGRIFNPGVK